jgi:hypothetical protein
VDAATQGSVLALWTQISLLKKKLEKDSGGAISIVATLSGLLVQS